MRTRILGGIDRFRRRRVWRRWTILWTASVLCHAPLAPAQPRRAAKPNIIFILADDLGYGDLGCYGQRRVMTPNLDRMAAEGMRFTACYAGSTVCAPSRSCLMTGTHTGTTRVRGNSPRVPLEPEDVTVAEVLDAAGYSTAIVGKWGIGEPGSTGIPNRQGFDEWFGFLNQVNAHNYYPEFLWENESKVTLEGNLGGHREQYAHDLFTQRALDYIERHREGPFFLYLAYTIPHANNEMGDEGMQVPEPGPYADRDWPEPDRNFAAMVTRLDSDVGRLFKKLKDLGIDRDTVVFFTSDNGPHREGGHDAEFFSSRGPLRGIKRALYEGGIRVPAIVRWPGKVRAGAVSDQVWAFWDFLPTAAELAGAEAAGPGDGISIAPTLLGRPQLEQHDYLYWEFHEGAGAMALRAGNWKAVWRGPEFRAELYDLENDLGERRNLAAGRPEIVRRLTETARRARRPSEHWKAPVPRDR